MRTLLLICTGLGWVATAHAQITVTEADLRAFANRTYTVAEFNATDPSTFTPLTKLRGGPYTFNFTGGTYDAPTRVTYTPVSCTPSLPGCDDPRLSGAGIIQRLSGDVDGMTLQFSDLDAASYRNRGAAARGDFDANNPGEESYQYTITPAALQIPLPLQMGSSWSTTYKGEFKYNGTVVVQEDATDQGNVVAYGTLTTPAGSDQALVVREQSVTQATVLGGGTSVDTTITYTFITRSALTATITTDARGTVQHASYSTTALGTASAPAARAQAGLLLEAPTPNPARDRARVAFTLDAPQNVRVSVHDLLGREMAVLVEGAYASGRHEALLDATRFAPGAYVVRLVGSSGTHTQLMTVAR